MAGQQFHASSDCVSAGLAYGSFSLSAGHEHCSGVFYFGMLIPLSASVTAGYLLPAVFAVATAIPVLAVAWILAFSVQQMGSFYGKMQKVQKWMNLLVGIVFILIGIYYCWIMYV